MLGRVDEINIAASSWSHCDTCSDTPTYLLLCGNSREACYFVIAKQNRSPAVL